MCGIAGHLDFSRRFDRDDAAAVTSMTNAIVHRGPDDAGTFVDEHAGIALAFRRLSILDLSPAGHQPMRSASGRYTIVFNGEIYNFRGLRADLTTRGHRFRGTSDTEVLLAATEEYGFLGMLTRINGMFAIAMWDADERALYLARDRIGEKPLYYGHASSGMLVFGSELKALRAHPCFEPRIDRGALMRFIRLAYVPSPLSIYQGVRKLPPGTWLRIAQSGDIDAPPVGYYSLQVVAERGIAKPLDVDAATAADLLDKQLRRAVREQMVADVPLGAFLSGGIDSSTIVALMQAQSTRPVRTFSIGFEDSSYDESAWARAVSAHLGTEHTEEIINARDALDVIPSISTVYDEPFADSSQIPTILVCRLARHHVTVALTGDGGDELFAGYPRYAVMRLLRMPFSLPGRRTVGILANRAVAALSREGTTATLDRRVLDWARRRTDVASVSDLDEFYNLYMSLWYHPGWVVRDAVEPPGTLPLSKDILAAGNVTERAMLADGLHNLPGALLVKVDRASMATSLETRMPLLDPEVIDLAWRLPFRCKVRGNVGKVVLRDVLSRYVPRELFERPKMGFSVPIVDWLRGPLRDWAESLLDERRLRDEGFLEPGTILRRWNAFQAGIRDWHGLLWTVLMWQSWLEAADL